MPHNIIYACLFFVLVFKSCAEDLNKSSSTSSQDGLSSSTPASDAPSTVYTTSTSVKVNEDEINSTAAQESTTQSMLQTSQSTPNDVVQNNDTKLKFKPTASSSTEKIDLNNGTLPENETNSQIDANDQTTQEGSTETVTSVTTEGDPEMTNPTATSQQQDETSATSLIGQTSQPTNDTELSTPAQPQQNEDLSTTTQSELSTMATGIIDDKDAEATTASGTADDALKFKTVKPTTDKGQNPDRDANLKDTKPSGFTGTKLALGITIPAMIVLVAVFGFVVYRKKKRSGRGYESLDDFGSFDGLQNPTYDVDL